MRKQVLDIAKRRFLSTYRLQLEKNFTFSDAVAVSDYIEKLGISHLYLSPVLEATPNSNHGYDGIDPTKISEERGGEKALQDLLTSFKRKKTLTGVILDIVPNHLSSSWQNPAWWDVLKLGPQSKHWKTFDIKPRTGNDYRVVLPVLGKRLPAVLASREIQLGLWEGQLVFRYYDKCYPLNPKSYASVLRALATELQKSPDGPAWASAVGKKKGPLSAPLTTKYFKEMLKWSRGQESYLEKIFRRLPVRVLEQTLIQQNYVLRDWRSGSMSINYRRFFDINDLAGIRVEDPQVFKWAHSKISELLKKYPNVVQGLRVDHIDGLTFPADYLKKLATLTPNIWTEKILGEGEKFPEQWPGHGSTGYEFSNYSGRLFVDVKGLLHLHSHYLRNIDDRWERFHDCVYDSKKEMLESHFSSELNYLSDLFYAQALKAKRSRVGFTKEDLSEVIVEVTSSLRVYRTYANQGKPIQSRWLDEALAEAEGRGRFNSKPAFQWFRGVLLGNGKWSKELFICIKRWEQLTGPVMAKGLEDTALYRYCPLLSLNGVGGEPDWLGDGSIEYHAFNQDRLRSRPLSMSTTSTHDTKRSEDVRSRIHLISELSEEWLNLFESLQELREKAQLKTSYQEPDTRGKYLIFETIIGAWPNDGIINEEFVGRMQRYFVKAAREAKTETSWSDVNSAYEEGLNKFVEALLKPQDDYGKSFLKRIQDFAEKCAYYGAFNSLSSVLLKATSPGLPDFYQGCELWDLSLVDPDNRRPVDYKLRHKYLTDLQNGLKKNRKEYLRGLFSRWQTGEVKLWLTWELLQLRQKMPMLFNAGDYLALDPQGDGKAHFVSYARKLDDQWLIVVAPRFLARKTAHQNDLVIENDDIMKTEIALPPGAPTRWKNLLNGESVEGSVLTMQALFGGMPVALLLSEDKK